MTKIVGFRVMWYQCTGYVADKTYELSCIYMVYRSHSEFRGCYNRQSGKDDLPMKPFHEKLKELVSARGLTAHGFAIKYGFNVSTISDIIEGRSNPKLDTVMKIAECLDISIAELLCDPGELVALDEKRAICNAMCKRICNYDDLSRSRLLGYMDCIDDDNKYI